MKTNNIPEPDSSSKYEMFSDSFYLEMKIWGILSDMLSYNRYNKYCGEMHRYKPISKILSDTEIQTFNNHILNKFGVYFTLKPNDRILNVVKFLIDEGVETK
jgi:hypothetical protein